MKIWIYWSKSNSWIYFYIVLNKNWKNLLVRRNFTGQVLIVRTVSLYIYYCQYIYLYINKETQTRQVERKNVHVFCYPFFLFAIYHCLVSQQNYLWTCLFLSFAMFIKTTKIHHGSIYTVCKKKLINYTKGYNSTHIENSHGSKFWEK